MVSIAMHDSPLLVPIASWARGGGGCLAEGTQVATPHGTVSIEKLKAGDPVWSLTDAGSSRKSPIHDGGTAGGVCGNFDFRIEIESDSGTPDDGGRGQYRLAGLLRVGDTVYLKGKGMVSLMR